MTFRSLLSIIVLFLLVSGALGQSQTSDSEAKVISSPPFTLSEDAEQAGIDGTFLLSVAIDEAGNVTLAKVLSGPSWPCGTDPKRELTESRKAVEELLLNSKFSPAIRDGKPIYSARTMQFTVGEAYQRKMREREREEMLEIGIPEFKVIQGGVMNGKAVSLPRPIYPPGARASLASGSVAIEVLINEKGKVIRAGAVSGHPSLVDPARDAACSARFSKTLLSGKPVRVNGVITYTFVP
jgi:hypothetical protein